MTPSGLPLRIDEPAAPAADLDLSSVTFSTSDGDAPCDGRYAQECSLEAVALAFWDRVCDCGPNPVRMCVLHWDALKDDVAQRGTVTRCQACGVRAWLVRVERIR